jgi:hypothetical protein
MITARSFAVIAFAAGVFLALPAGAQAPGGAYRGMFVCEKMKASPDILHVPLDLVVRNETVQFARPLFNWNGTRVVGSELGTGTIDPQGNLHLSSRWDNRGVIFQGEYNGTLAATGGTLSGTQSWRGGEGIEGHRNCTAALVTLPGATEHQSEK